MPPTKAAAPQLRQRELGPDQPSRSASGVSTGQQPALVRDCPEGPEATV